MAWRELLQTNDETCVSPWTGGRALSAGERTWTIEGALPPEHGWFTFRVAGRRARAGAPAEPATELLHDRVKGYLVGDRLVRDAARVDPDPSRIIGSSERVHLVEAGLDRFARVVAGRTHEGGPLVFEGQEMPLGAEDDVLAAYLDQAPSLEGVKGVPPALDAAFRMETWRRGEAARRRAAIERKRAEEEALRRRDEQRRELTERLGDATQRRAMAIVDFGDAARAALTIGGADYLDHRASARRGEQAVRFRLLGRRFECTCDARTLQIVDAGICLTDHDTDERGDTRFTLESLPAVILQAEREHKLVVFRRAD